jgi:predicted PurR-regulated permease PerM
MEDMTGRWAWLGNRGSAARREPDATAPETPEDALPDERRAAEAPDTADGEGTADAPDTAEAPGTADAADAGASAKLRTASVSRLPREPPVPAWLARAAAWSWRLLLVGLLVYLVFRVASRLQLVILPCIAALLLTALLHPVAVLLRRRGLSKLASTWVTVLATVVVLVGFGVLAVNQVTSDYPRLQAEVRHTAHDVQTSLAGAPFHISRARLGQYSHDFAQFLSQHKTQIAGTLFTGGRVVLDLAAGAILTVFIMFFLLKDGYRIWRWLMQELPSEARRRADDSGEAAWSVLVNYMRGTTAVAAIHALFIGIALGLLRVPLLVPLIILVFIAAYLPLVGIFIAGTVVILVTLGTKGWIAAAIMIGVFILEGQIEGHLLQPLLIGRIVRLHPLAIILVLAVGGVIGGIAGAIVAVPAAAAITVATPYLRGKRAPPDGGPLRAGARPPSASANIRLASGKVTSVNPGLRPAIGGVVRPCPA